MKRGFTLIELLAVIVILRIILAIAIPSVGRIIENSRINTFNRSEELLVNAARTYLALNEENAPRSVGDTIEIKASDLEQLQLLDQIKNPWGNNNCSAYVLATKMSNNTYNYSPHINCTNEITNSSDDKLVAHYKFDDIVEPTENIISNPLDPTKWQTTTYMDKNYGFISHRFVDTDLGVKGYERTIDSSDWRATMVRIPWQPITDMDSDYTFSIYVRALENIEGAEVYLSYEGKNSTGTRVDVGKTYYFSNSNWQRIELTANLKSCDFVSVSNYMKVYPRSNNGKQVTIQIALPQMEKKSYSTEFTEGIRLGQVLDYSLNNNHGLMELEAYPKISNDSPNDSLSYIFDGVDDFIKIPKYNLPDNATIALWVKTSTTYGSQIIIGDSHSISFGFYINYLIGYAGTTKPTGSYGSCFKNNEWNHLAVTIENGNLSYYCNGSKISTGSLNNWIWPESDYAYIGRRTENKDLLPYYFRGNMDDLRIYGRVLSDSEIRSIYYSRK